MEEILEIVKCESERKEKMYKELELVKDIFDKKIDIIKYILLVVIVIGVLVVIGLMFILKVIIC